MKNFEQLITESMNEVTRYNIKRVTTGTEKGVEDYKCQMRRYRLEEADCDCQITIPLQWSI